MNCSIEKSGYYRLYLSTCNRHIKAVLTLCLLLCLGYVSCINLRKSLNKDLVHNVSLIYLGLENSGHKLATTGRDKQSQKQFKFLTLIYSYCQINNVNNNSNSNNNNSSNVKKKNVGYVIYPLT